VKTLSIDLFADFVCPWCLIGARRLDRALERVPPGVDVTVRHHPFLLDASVPEAGEDLLARLRRRYGGDPRRLQARVEEVARGDGIPLDFARVPRTYPTAAAHTLVRHAAARGTQRALAGALFDAYFLEGRNIADAEELAAIAAAHGFEGDQARALARDPDELAVTRELAEGAARAGISGVPFLVFDRKLAVSGAQPVAVLEEAIARALGGAAAEEDARE
jgi:predicted DsbA family dithiol-disulfide isomerase